MQMTERKTQYLPSVPDLPMDFAHVFQGKVVTLLQSTFSSYTIHSYELEFYVTSWNCCMLLL